MAQKRRGASVGRVLSGTALCATLLFAALPIASSAASYRFSSVKIEGNQAVDPATILSMAGIAKGATLSDGALNDAAQKLQATGLFASVDLIPSGGTLVIRVKENPTLNVVSIEGNRRFKDEELSKVIKSQGRRIYSAAQAEADANALAKFYSDKSRMAARVEPKVIDRGNNRYDLVFEVSEGKSSEVERLSFTGNQAFSDRRLRQVLATKQAGIFRAIISRDTFVPDRVEADKQLLLDFYHSRGYIDAQVRGVSSEFSNDRNAFFLSFDVQEGQAYSFNRVGVASEYPGLDVTPFQDVIRIRQGATYSPVAIDTTIRRMEAIAKRQGVDFLAIEPRIAKNPATQTLDVTFVLTKGPRTFVERIDVQGNVTTQDRVIRRQFQISEGDPMNPRAIREAADRIRALDYFKNVDVTAHSGSAEDQVVVNVGVEEKPTGSLSFGATYSSTDKIGLTIGLSEANLLGRGQYLAANIATTKKNQSNSITFIEPALLDRNVKLKFDLWYNTSDYSNARFATKRAGTSLALEFPLAEQLRLNLEYRYSADKIYNVATGSSPLLYADEALGFQRSSVLGYALSYDTRITGLNPNGGLLLTFGQDYAGLGGDVKSVTTSAKATYETKVWHEELTLHGEAEAGVVSPFGGQTTTYMQRFTGNGLVRGFAANGFGPRDLSVANRDALGGNMYAGVRLEARFPIGLPAEYGISGGVFADAGSVWGLDNPGAIDDSMHLRSSVGFTIFWDSGLGPLRMNFAKPIKKESYDKTQTFDLTVSTKF